MLLKKQVLNVVTKKKFHEVMDILAVYEKI